MSVLLWLWLAAVWRLAAATLLPWSPGYALALNTHNDTEFAYSYPRRLSRAFTIEFWMRGNGVQQGTLLPLSIAHPQQNNLVVIFSDVYVFSNTVASVPQCPLNTWCHVAVSINVTAFPAYNVRTYLNGKYATNGTGVLTNTNGLTASALEDETLSIVMGQEQDTQLGSFNPVEIYCGHIDEFRIWNTIRTPQEIQQTYNLSLTAPYPSSLVSYYTFDASEWGPGYYEDRVNSSERHRLYVADSASPPAAPQPPPGYAPPAAPLTRHAVSTAPVCAASGGGALMMRAVPGGTLSIPVAALACGTSPSAVTVVTAAVGGAVAVYGQNALNVGLSGSRTLLFTASSSGIMAGAGFNFTVTDGSATVSGFLAVLPNTAPVLPASMALMSNEGMMVSTWITATDPDQDIVSVEVVVPPTAGVARTDGLVNRTVQYTPPTYLSGYNVGQYWLRAHDMWGAMSSNMLVTVSLVPEPQQPQLLVNTSFTIYRGQRLAIPFTMVDPNNVGPFAIVSDWPSGDQGYLQAEDKGQTWIINDAMMSANMQWASGFGNFSSMYGANTGNVSYSISQIEGPPQCPQVYGDCNYVWSPSTRDGNCVNRASPAEAFYTFYTEYFEAKFAHPVYLNAVILFEPWGGDRVSRVRVPSDRNAAQWKTLMSRDVADTPASASLTEYTVESLSICQTLWPIDTVRIEGDTCHRSGWWDVDAIQIRGGSVPMKNILNVTAKLSFTATPGYTGTVTFGLTATTCYGSYDQTSQPISINVTVINTPHVLTVVASNQGSTIDVGQLTACGPRSGNVQALELPTAGKLSYMDTVLNATLVDLGSPSTTFQYVPFECNPQLRDSFLVQLGPTAVVQVKVVGCVTRGSQLLILVALVVLVVPLLFGPGFVHWRQTRHQRDNSRAPKDTSRPIGVLFTDIQASTLLWGEAPELMAQALDVHHDVIRAAIRKHRCYEVKTIGDSFMVVSEDPVALLRLALAIQEALYDHDWGHEAFDDVYRRQTGCALRAEAYGRRWHGLRVRIGVHYGPAQVTFDETTKGYDYYGNVVNTAARIEGAGHGGQVLMSREAHEQVADHYGALDVHAQPLGYVQLRGVRAPLDLIQILPARFADRTFPPLRTDHAGDEDDASEDGLSSGYEQSGKSERVYPQAFDRDVLTHPLVRTGAVSSEVAAFHAHSVFYTLRSQLNMVQNSDERRKWLRDLCRKWHVPCHSVGEDQENGTLGRLTLQLMGSVVTQMRSKQRANSFLSQGIVSPGVVASPPMSPTPVIMMPSPSRKYFHSVQVYPVLDSP